MEDSSTSKSRRSRQKITPTDARELLLDSRGYCGNPACSNTIQSRATKTGPLVLHGEIAHIVAASDNGPRGNSEFDESKREAYDNLILLCERCHKIVDAPGNFSDYSVEKLTQWKEYLRKRREENNRRIETPEGYQEISDLLENLATSEGEASATFDRVAIDDKIQVNSFGRVTQAKITRNLRFMAQVSAALEQGENRMPNFSDGVESTLVRLYIELKRKELDSDAIFHQMTLWLTVEGDTARCESVVEIVLTYFFERCVIFEKA